MKAGSTHLLSVTALVVMAAILEMEVGKVRGDDMGNFFLKASKSVPRIGRRSDLDFMKASKSIPRIGRRRDSAVYFGPGKRYFSEKDFGESGDWGSLEQMQGDQPFRDIDQYPDVIWQMKKDPELEEARRQALV